MSASNPDSNRSCYNFSPGPAVLPSAVHQQLTEDLNASRPIPLLELGHRTPEFDRIAEASQANLRELLAIPKEYAVLFLPGGARSQYFAVPLNIASQASCAAYFDTGHWSQCAIKEAQKYIKVATTTAVDATTPYSLPSVEHWNDTPDAAYHHYVANETLTGFEFSPQNIRDGSLVSDMTSNLLTQEVDIARHRLIYASAQKNFGIAGITVVIVAKDQLDKADPRTPSVYHYAIQDKSSSRWTTPPVLSWYVCHLMLEWIKREGGVKVMQQRSIERSRPIYHCIDQSDLYQGLVAHPFRSRLNISFRIEAQGLEALFLEKAQHSGLLGLKGHSAVGGVRASLYNGMSQEGANALKAFMEEFERTA